MGKFECCFITAGLDYTFSERDIIFILLQGIKIHCRPSGSRVESFDMKDQWYVLFYKEKKNLSIYIRVSWWKDDSPSAMCWNYETILFIAVIIIIITIIIVLLGLSFESNIYINVIAYKLSTFSTDSMR